MDLQKTIELLAAKGNSRHITGEALVVMYMNEDAGVLDTHLSGDLINMKRLLTELGKNNGFFRKILLDSADAVRVYLKNKES